MTLEGAKFLLKQCSQPPRKNEGWYTYNNISLDITITKEYGILDLKKLGLSQMSQKLGPLDLLTRNVLDFKKNWQFLHRWSCHLKTSAPKA